MGQICTFTTRCASDISIQLTINRFVTDPNHDDDGHDMAAARRSRKKAPVELETDADGRPLLTDPDEGKGLELRAMAPIVRSYITAYYSEWL